LSEENNHFAIFAGGCFWCLEPAFDKTAGVLETIVGYTGGHTKNPTYYSISSGKTGHYEAIKVVYDPSKVSFEKLIDVFWKNINPTQADGQFADRGSQYQTAVFYSSQAEKEQAETSKKDLEMSGKFNSPIVTKILPRSHFYPAEEEHQDYYLKQSDHYNRYKEGSGRGPYIREKWQNKK